MRTGNWLKMGVVASAIAMQMYVGSAESRSWGKDLVLVPQQKLPVATQQLSEAELLHPVSCDTSYLYLEQRGGTQLLVLDVSDPGHARLKASVALPVRSSFRFVQPLNRTQELIRYDDGSGYAVLHLEHAKQPFVTAANTNGSERLEPGLVSPPPLEAVAPQEYRLIDKNGAATPIPGVLQIATDAENGATYLVGEHGLTIVRDPHVEALAVPCQRYSDDYDTR